MATMNLLLSQTGEIVDDVYKRINDAEIQRGLEFIAAVKIQAWFRATRIRRYIRKLHKNAVQIQCQWRGYLGRKKFQMLIKERVFRMKLVHYYNMATLVQKIWRGYYVRKYVFNYYSRKRYLEGLMVKNEIVRQELKEFEEQEKQNRMMHQEDVLRKRLEEYARRNHYLVSTEVIPGIYNSPFRIFPDEMEFHLRNVPPRSHNKETKKTVYDPGYKRYDLPQLEPLPPIHPKPQGPFRDLREVQKQRYKPFQPSLRVATSYTSVEEARQKMKDEEWVTRLNDNIFVPFSKRSRSYDPLLHTTSMYGHLPYGTNYFREEFVEKFIIPQNFRSVVPPVPILEKLNDTYSQGQV